jgi:hypothetical protein
MHFVLLILVNIKFDDFFVDILKLKKVYDLKAIKKNI